MKIEAVINGLCKHSLGETVYFMFKNKLYLRKIQGVELPGITLSVDKKLIFSGDAEYKFFSNGVTNTDYIMRINHADVKVKCSECFITREELFDHIDKTLD